MSLAHVQLMGIVEGGKCASQSVGGKQRNADGIHDYLAAKTGHVDYLGGRASLYKYH